MHCDLCRKSDGLIQCCAFGEMALDLCLHRFCQSRLLAMTLEEQDASIASAVTFNRETVGSFFQRALRDRMKKAK